MGYRKKEVDLGLSTATGARALLRKWYEAKFFPSRLPLSYNFLLFHKNPKPSDLGKSKRQGSFLYLLSWECAGTRTVPCSITALHAWIILLVSYVTTMTCR